MNGLCLHVRHEDPSAWLASPAPSEGTLEVTWTGQAGFLLRTVSYTLAVDLYLSDSLAEKYRRTEFPHTRMTAPALSFDALAPVQIILCSHGHSDHMDPGTLGPLYATESNRAPLCICPRAETEKARDCAVPSSRTVALNAFETFMPGVPPSCMVTAVPAAHETLAEDVWGNMKALGYIIQMNGFTIYHSGDCIPFDGLEELLAPYCIDLALLPVNGRKTELSRKGILGNFTAGEACRLASEIGAKFFIPHHFGMFSFNTIDTDRLARILAETGWKQGESTVIPETGIVYSFKKDESHA